MAYVKVETGNTMSSSEMNANFEWIGAETILPTQNQDLENTTGSLDLGSDNYKWDNTYCESINADTTIDGAWYRVANVEVTATASSVVVSGLNGDTDIMYMIIGRVRQYASALSSNWVRLRINAIGGGGDYGMQFLKADAGAVVSGRNTATAMGIIVSGNTPATISVAFFKSILYEINIM